MKKAAITLISALFALSASAELTPTHYWQGGVLNTITNWSHDFAGSDKYVTGDTFSSSDVYDKGASGTSTSATNFGNNSLTLGTFRNTQNLWEMYFGVNGAVSIAGIESHTAGVETRIRTTSGGTRMDATIGTVNVSDGLVKFGTGYGMRTTTILNSIDVSGGTLEFGIGSSGGTSYNVGTFNSVGATIKNSGGIINITIPSNALATPSTATLGSVVLEGSTNNASLNLGTSATYSFASASITSLTVKNDNNTLTTFVADGGASVTNLILDSTGSAATLALRGSDSATLNVGTLEVKGSNLSTLNNMENARLQHMNVATLSIGAGGQLSVNFTNRNLILDAVSIDLKNADKTSAIIAAALGTGSISKGDSDYITLDFTNMLIDETYKILEITNGTLTLSDFYVDSSLGELSLSDDGKSLMFKAAIPEPAEWAAIFGLLSLALVAYKRK